METIYSTLADCAVARYKDLPSSKKRLLIALAGPPGSEKTTVANRVAARINASLQDSTSALVISIDSFHLPRSALDLLSNREEAYVRRGAHWTFDAAAAVAFVKKARSAEGELYAPTFDHAVKDPVDGGLCIPSESRILIFEGLYLPCDLQPWSDVAALVDEKRFVDVDEDVARQRVAQRHVSAGIETNIHDALRRVDANDTLNGIWVRERKGAVDVLVRSIEEKEQRPVESGVRRRIFLFDCIWYH